jgi:multiple sugar transport system ATP-binding protein
VIEWLGSEQFAYVPFEAPEAVRKQLAELERELDSEALRTQLVVSIDSASRLTRGDEAELFVDTSKMHLFDPTTGDNLTLAAAGGAHKGD